MKNLITAMRKVFFVLFIVFAISNIASAGWFQEPGRLMRETISGQKDHVGGGVREVGQAAGVLVQYQITITNRSDNKIFYNFDGQPATLPPQSSVTWDVKNVSYTVKVQFDNAHQQQVKYDVGGGRYVFMYQSGVLNFMQE